MAATTESVKADAAEAPLLKKETCFSVLRCIAYFTHGFVGTRVYTAGQLVWTHSHLNSKHTG